MPDVRAEGSMARAKGLDTQEASHHQSRPALVRVSHASTSFRTTMLVFMPALLLYSSRPILLTHNDHTDSITLSIST